MNAAFESGEVAPERWRSFEKMRKETEYQRRRGDAKAESEARKKWKSIHLEAKERNRVFGKPR